MSQAVRTALFTPLWIRMIFWEQAVPPDLFPSLSLAGCTCGKAEVRPGSVKSTTLRVFPRLKPCLLSMPTEWEMLKTENSFSSPESQDCVCKSSFPGGTLGTLPKAVGTVLCQVGTPGRTEHSRSCWEGISLCCRYSELRVLLGSIPMAPDPACFPASHRDTGQQNLGGHSWDLGELEAKLKVCPLKEVVICKPKQSAVPRGVWDW